MLRRYSLEFNKPVTSVSPEALAALEEYGWPGNVRELQNVIERSEALVEGVVIQLQDLPLDPMRPDHGARARQAETLPLQEACERFERQIVLRVLERTGWIGGWGGGGSSEACNAGLSVAISSRKRVPPCASSNLPSFR